MVNQKVNTPHQNTPNIKVKNSLHVVGDAPSLGDCLDVSNCATDIRSLEETPGASY